MAGAVVDARDHFERDLAERARGVAHVVGEQVAEDLLPGLEAGFVPGCVVVAGAGLEEWVLHAAAKAAVGVGGPDVRRVVGHGGAGVQPDRGGAGRVSAAVLRARAPHAGGGEEGGLQLSLCLVLQGRL